MIRETTQRQIARSDAGLASLRKAMAIRPHLAGPAVRLAFTTWRCK